MKPSAQSRILYLISTFYREGAQAQVAALATGLKERGWKVGIVSMVRPEAYLGRLERAGVEIFSLGMRRGRPNPAGLFKLWPILKKVRPDILHGHMFHSNIIARLSRLVHPQPVVFSTVHARYEGGRARTVAYRLTDSLTELSTHVSLEGMERYLKIKAVRPGRMIVIPNGIDTNEFRPNPEARVRTRQALGLGAEFVWLAVGRLDADKDYPNMLLAFNNLYPGRPENRLLIAGQGPLQSRIEDMVSQLGLQASVRLLGLRKDVPDLMNAADAFVLSSATEGFSLVTAEALASGLPVAATDAGGVGEVLGHGRYGLLAPVRNPEALAGAMLHLTGLSEDERRPIALEGRRYVVKKFGVKRMIDNWEDLYKESLDRK